MRILDLMKTERSLERRSLLPVPAPTAPARFASPPIPSGLRRCLYAFVLVVTGITTAAQATVTTLSFQPSPADTNDLDHHLAYTWRLDHVSLSGQAITSATLAFNDISSWDSNPNVLHLHLLDNATNPGVTLFVDDPTRGVLVTNLTDDLMSARYHDDRNWLLKAGTADTFLADPSFVTTGVDYTVTSSQLRTLASYIASNGDLAFGLNPDGHFFNDGIKFTMALTPVPEMAALYPILSLCAAIAFTRILHRRRSARLEAIKIADR